MISAASVFASALVSSLGTALWNLDLAVLVELVALVLIVRRGRPHGLSGVAAVGVGLCLFAAFAVRPSTAPFIAAVLVYLAIRDRRGAILAGVTAAGSLLVWAWALGVATGAAIPDYYSLRRVTVERSFSILEAVHGHLLSPSRGLFVYSPLLVVTVVAVAVAVGRLRRDLLAWVAVGWIAAHLLLASVATRWWSGPAYGPRILSDALPAWILLTAMAWQAISEDRRQIAVGLAVAYVALALPGVAINSYAGLYRPATVLWNGIPPHVDAEPDVVFDWGAPQWAASIDSLCDRNREYLDGVLDETGGTLAPFRLGEEISVDTDDAIWFGWAFPKGISRWTECKEATVAFSLEDGAPGDAAVVIRAAANGVQRVEVSVNGVRAGSMVFPGPVVSRRAAVPPEVLRFGEINRITLAIPDAATRDRDNARLLGLRLLGLTTEHR